MRMPNVIIRHDKTVTLKKESLDEMLEICARLYGGRVNDYTVLWYSYTDNDLNHGQLDIEIEAMPDEAGMRVNNKNKLAQKIVNYISNNTLGLQRGAVVSCWVKILQDGCYLESKA